MPSVARVIYPRSLGIEDCLGQGEPRGLIGLRILEVGLGCGHGGHAPECLVVVPHRRGPIRGHHIVVITGLKLNSRFGQVVVCRISRIMPVINQSSPHSTRLPPVVCTLLIYLTAARFPTNLHPHGGFGGGPGSTPGIPPDSLP